MRRRRCKAYAVHPPRLLRSAHHRVQECRSAAKRDQLAPFTSITSSARAKIDEGIMTPIALAVWRFTASSDVVGCSNGKSAGLDS
jgi:hypothetical protein